jgi:outer membrane immunogenic protein
MKYGPFLLSPLGLIPAGMQPTDAADLPVKAPAPAHVTSFDPSWAGFYAGANLGAVFDHSRQTAFSPDPGTPGSYCWGGASSSCTFNNSQTATGVLGGFQIGYNFQNGKWVYGAELDFDLSSARKTTSATNSPAFFGNWTNKTGVEALGTARLRLGYAFDQALIYATGGLAYAKMVNTFQAGSGGNGYTWSDTGWRTGFALGGGIEYMLTRNVSIKGEGLYYNLGDKDHISQELPSFSRFGLTDHMTGAVARIGINYIFH